MGSMSLGGSPTTTVGLLAGVIAVQLCTIDAPAEVCRFAGTTNYAGRVAVTAAARAADSVTRIAFPARHGLLLDQVAAARRPGRADISAWLQS
jgi:hypothetical protein